MPNAKAVAEIPAFWRENITLTAPDHEYDGQPAYKFPNDNCPHLQRGNRNLRLLLDTVEIRYVGVASSLNKRIELYHRAIPPQLVPAPGTFDWDYEIANHSGAQTSIIFNEHDFARIYFYPGDSLFIVWDAEHECEVNICVTCRQV